MIGESLIATLLSLVALWMSFRRYQNAEAEHHLSAIRAGIVVSILAWLLVVCLFGIPSTIYFVVYSKYEDYLGPTLMTLMTGGIVAALATNLAALALQHKLPSMRQLPSYQRLKGVVIGALIIGCLKSLLSWKAHLRYKENVWARAQGSEIG